MSATGGRIGAVAPAEPEPAALRDRAGAAPGCPLFYRFLIHLSHRHETNLGQGREIVVVEPMRPSRRGTRRWSILWPAVLVHGEREHACTMLDISEYGARIEVPRVSGEPVPVTLKCPQFGELAGVLVWWRGGQAGMRFDLSPAEVFGRLKTVVPGLNRKDPALLSTARSGAARSSFGRIAKAELGSPAPRDEQTENN